MLARDNERLIEVGDLDRADLDLRDRHVTALKTTMNWVERFLCRPHPDLGRPGAVCPWTQPSLNRRLLWQAVIEGDIEEAEVVESSLRRYRDWFLDLDPTDPFARRFKTILVLFPDIDASRADELIDAVQLRLKPSFVSEGMMVGQFHAACPEPGLRNPAFRPLRSPVPMLAMRFMVETDKPFLEHSPELLATWTRLFGVRASGCPVAH